MKKSPFRHAQIPYEIETLQDLVIQATEHFPSSVIQVFENKETVDYPYSQLRNDIFSLSSVLNRLIPQNAQIALIGRNSYQWISAFLAIAGSAATAVLIDRDMPKEAMEKNLAQTDVQCVICDSDLVPVLQELCPEIPVLPLQWQIGNWGCYAFEVSKEFERKAAPDDIAAIIFTSGSTGVNKGVLLSHKNLTSDMKASQLLTGVNETDSIFTVLPPQHAFQLVTGILVPLYCGMRIGIGRGLKYVQKDFMLFKPTFMVLVPMIVRALYHQTWRAIERKEMTEKIQRGVKLSNALLKIGIDQRKRLFYPVLKGFGGELRSIICGGAHLESPIVSGMNELGIRVMTGYGITECSPVVCCNMPKYHRLGSVGMPTPYGEVRIENEEILVRGDIVSQGYYKMPKLTAEAYADGWFHTGDLGYLDKDGFLFISGRKKNILVLSNGKNVSPEELENELQGIPGVKEACVCLEQVNELDFLTALVYPDEERLEKLGLEALIDDLQKNIQEMNKTLPVYKRVKTVQLLSKELCHTASGKLLRHHPLSEDNQIAATIRIS